MSSPRRNYKIFAIDKYELIFSVVSAVQNRHTFPLYLPTNQLGDNLLYPLNFQFNLSEEAFN